MQLRSYPDTNFITGMRGIAAIMVMVVHSAAFTDISFLPHSLSSLGKYGVQIFFVIAGFTVASNAYASMSFKSFAVRRSFRLLIPYFTALFISLFVAMFFLIGPAEKHFVVGGLNYSLFADILLHVSLLNLFIPELSGSILGVEWSISLEFFMYFVVFLMIHKGVFEKNNFWLLLTAILIFTIAVKEITKYFFGWHFSHIFPLSYSFYFALGVVAYLIRRNLISSGLKYERLSLILFFLTWALQPGAAGFLFGAATFLMLIGSKHNHSLTAKFLSSRVMIFLGTISYSFYLYHFLVIMILRDIFDQYGYAVPSYLLFLCSLLVTILVSTISYNLVETPSTKLGKRLALKVN